MLKKFLFLGAFTVFCNAAAAQEKVTYLEEVKALGFVSGQGLACNAEKYDDFEMLARAIMLTKAPSDEALQKGVYAYNEAKASAYSYKRMDGGFLCDEIVSRFNSQDIFGATLYEDGTIKMPNGQILTPRRPYDASQIYRKDKNERKRLKAMYDSKIKEKAALKSVSGSYARSASSGKRTNSKR